MRFLLLLFFSALGSVATGFVVVPHASLSLKKLLILRRASTVEPGEPSFLSSKEERPALSKINDNDTDANDDGTAIQPLSTTQLPYGSFVAKDNARLDSAVATSTTDSSASWSMAQILELANPISWLGPTLAAGCGAIATGNVHGVDSALPILMAMILVGPFWEGFAQTLDALCSKMTTPDDEETAVDAVAKEHGDLIQTVPQETQVGLELAVLLLGGLGWSVLLDSWGNNFSAIIQLSFCAYGLSFLYAAPPIQLFKRGWAGHIVPQLTTLALPWMCGQAVMLAEGGSLLDQPQAYLLPIVYSMVGLGPALLADLRDPNPKRGIRNNPQDLAAKWKVVQVQDGIQLGMALYLLLGLGEPLGAAALTALVLPQMFVQKSLLFSNLLENDLQSFVFSQPFIYAGLLVTALSVGHHAALLS